MKRTSHQGEINNNEQTKYEFPARRSGGHQVIHVIENLNYNHQINSNFEILHR